MPKPRVSDGPWGEAIRHLLDSRNLSQADLVRAVNEDRIARNYAGRRVQAKTISSAVRGFPTQTRVLGRIAEALNVQFEEVLVAPSRRLQNEQRERLAQEIAARVLREMEARVGNQEDKSTELAFRLMRLTPESRARLEGLIASTEVVEREGSSQLTADSVKPKK